MLNISQVKLQVNTRTALEITSIYINIRDIISVLYKKIHDIYLDRIASWLSLKYEESHASSHFSIATIYFEVRLY